jgi:hypothetical protein
MKRGGDIQIPTMWPSKSIRSVSPPEKTKLNDRDIWQLAIAKRIRSACAHVERSQNTGDGPNPLSAFLVLTAHAIECRESGEQVHKLHDQHSGSFCCAFGFCQATRQTFFECAAHASHASAVGVEILRGMSCSNRVNVLSIHSRSLILSSTEQHVTREMPIRGRDTRLLDRVSARLTREFAA